MTQTLMLLRHAKAVPWGYDVDDFSRSLAPRGKRHMARLSTWAAAHLASPNYVLCSSSARTVETLEPFLRVWPGLVEHTQYLDDLYHASAGSLHHHAGKALLEHGSVLMIGHNPGFESLAFSLLERNTALPLQRMATGTLGVFEFPEGFASGEAALLRHWVTRHDLSAD